MNLMCSLIIFISQMVLNLRTSYVIFLYLDDTFATEMYDSVLIAIL